MTKTKLLVFLFIGILQFSEEKPTTPRTTTTEIATDNKSSAESLHVTLEPDDTAKTVSSTEKLVKNSSNADDLAAEIPLPPDLSSGDILLDPSLILARAERSVKDSEDAELTGSIGESLHVGRSEDGIPTFYFVRFVRVPRSTDNSHDKFEPEKNGQLRKVEESDKTVKRFSRSAKNDGAKDSHSAEKGFIVKPVFKYREEELKNYPRYPVFPGK